MSYEQQCNLLASETLGVSSRMSKAEMREYLEQIRAHYAQQGIVLKDPEEMR
jgi:bifunctional N-acetylglucosamine-1-phosphate-uridyltransferase/glucosamine-1-phosphate-acetyltransferase GlmU-like protein